MSSLRNSLHRRNHKERSQLSHRAKFGVLEKHKDYVLRAKDYHSKQDRIQRLRQKAADRNKDEFYFGMNRQRTQGGVHVQTRGNVAMPVDLVKILKTQDENYIRTMRTAGLKKIEKLKAQLSALADLLAPHLRNDDEEEEGLDEEDLAVLSQSGLIKSNSTSKRSSKRSSKHLLFADNEEEAQQLVNRRSSDEAQATSKLEDARNTVDLGWKEPTRLKKRKQREDAESLGSEDKSLQATERREEAKKHRTSLLKELSARLKRDTQLRYAEQELAMQRRLMGKGGSLKLRGVEKIEGDDDAEELNEDELDSMKIKKSVQLQLQKEHPYKPRVYKWRLERKK